MVLIRDSDNLLKDSVILDEVTAFKKKCATIFIELINLNHNGITAELARHGLKDGAQRSGELQKSITDISNRMFTYSIRGLEKDNLVKRKVYPVTPPKVEYELTEEGKSLIPIVLELNKWGQGFASKHHLYAP